MAEHVLAAARYNAEGRIGLRAAPGGYSTPPYERSGVVEELRVAADELHVHRDGAEITHPLTTIAAAANAVNIEPGAPAHVYTPYTSLEPAAPLTVDLRAAEILASWFALGWSVLEELAGTARVNDAPPEITLWPEHFDAAVELGSADVGARGTFGVSPGDHEHLEPYLYVTHWAGVPTDLFWNDAAFAGASLGYGILRASTDPSSAALDFYRRGLAVLSAPRS